MPTQFRTGQMSVFASATSAEAVTPSDTGDHKYAALWIGGAGAGNLKITTPEGEDITFASVPTGFFSVACDRVWSTGTDVTAIIGLNW